MLDAGFGTLQSLKNRLLPQSVAWDMTWDDQIARLGLAVAGRMNAFCNRVFQRVEGQTDEFNAAASAIVLRAFPVETINSVSVRTFTGALDVYDGGYQIDQRAGLMHFGRAVGSGTERIVVDYDGGFWLDNGGTMPAGATPMPDDLIEAWALQCQAWAEARRIFGEIALQSLNPKSERPSSLTLASDVTAILEPYRRFSNE